MNLFGVFIGALFAFATVLIIVSVCCGIRAEYQYKKYKKNNPNPGIPWWY